MTILFANEFNLKVKVCKHEIVEHLYYKYYSTKTITVLLCYMKQVFSIHDKNILQQEEIKRCIPLIGN